MTNPHQREAVCPSCRHEIVIHADGAPDDLARCECTVVSLEWLNLAKQTSEEPTEAMPWFERAIREHEAKHGPSGGAWNISAVLDCLRRSQQSGKAGGIMLEMAQASREQEMWERRFEAICRTHPIWRSADHDGSFGLRDFLEYIAPICGFDASKVRGSQQSGSSHE